jgi:hypothetical protein
MGGSNLVISGWRKLMVMGVGVHRERIKMCSHRRSHCSSWPRCLPYSSSHSPLEPAASLTNMCSSQSPLEPAASRTIGRYGTNVSFTQSSLSPLHSVDVHAKTSAGFQIRRPSDSLQGGQGANKD